MNSDIKSSRLFQNDFLESLTHVHHNTPFFIYMPTIVALLATSILVKGFSLSLVAGMGLAGLLFWTLFEYLLHRFVFHYEPSSAWGKKIAYLFHGIHHDCPDEKDRLVMPTATSVPIASAMFVFFYGLLGIFSFPAFAGFMSGYLYYEFVHYSVHHKKKRGWLWNDRQRKEHLTHHFKDADHCFGVTSPLWDFVFGTY